MNQADLDFRSLEGHDLALDSLRQEGRVRPYPSLVFSGPSGLGKRLCGIWYAAFLNCLQTDDDAAPCGTCGSCQKLLAGGHPDLHLSRVPDKKTVVGVSDVREVIYEINHAPYEGRFRVWVIEEGERLNDEAQNALLKTLEEPPPRAVIVLVTHSQGTLLPTVSSRCRLMRFQALPNEQIDRALRKLGADEDRAASLAALCNGCYGKALRLYRDADVWEEQEQILDLFSRLPGADLWGAIETAQQLERTKHTNLRDQLGLGMSLFRDLLVLSAGSTELVVHKERLEFLETLAANVSLVGIRGAVREFQEAEQFLHYNVNPRLLLQRLCIELSEVQ